jgi:hypothetical protein
MLVALFFLAQTYFRIEEEGWTRTNIFMVINILLLVILFLTTALDFIGIDLFGFDLIPDIDSDIDSF